MALDRPVHPAETADDTTAPAAAAPATPGISALGGLAQKFPPPPPDFWHGLGLDLKGWVGTDANRYRFGPEMLSATEDGKWVSSDNGKAIKVRVSFTDDAGYEESLTSIGTAAVVMGGL